MQLERCIFCLFSLEISHSFYYDQKFRKDSLRRLHTGVFRQEGGAASFLNYIFVCDADTLDKDIFGHGFTHVIQHHTWDILFIELYKVFFCKSLEHAMKNPKMLIISNVSFGKSEK